MRVLARREPPAGFREYKGRKGVARQYIPEKGGFPLITEFTDEGRTYRVENEELEVRVFKKVNDRLELIDEILM